jgi:hypothetical protein
MYESCEAAGSFLGPAGIGGNDEKVVNFTEVDTVDLVGCPRRGGKKNAEEVGRGREVGHIYFVKFLELVVVVLEAVLAGFGELKIVVGPVVGEEGEGGEEGVAISEEEIRARGGDEGRNRLDDRQGASEGGDFGAKYGVMRLVGGLGGADVVHKVVEWRGLVCNCDATMVVGTEGERTRADVRQGWGCGGGGAREGGEKGVDMVRDDGRAGE